MSLQRFPACRVCADPVPHSRPGASAAPVSVNVGRSLYGWRCRALLAALPLAARSADVLRGPPLNLHELLKN